MKWENQISKNKTQINSKSLNFQIPKQFEILKLDVESYLKFEHCHLLFCATKINVSEIKYE